MRVCDTGPAGGVFPSFSGKGVDLQSGICVSPCTATKPCKWWSSALGGQNRWGMRAKKKPSGA